jgi:hypothetical protein
MTDDNPFSSVPLVPVAPCWVPQKITKLTELPVTIELEDGTLIVVRLVVGGVAKDVNHFTPEGGGVYMVMQQTNVFTVDGKDMKRRN